MPAAKSKRTTKRPASAKKPAAKKPAAKRPASAPAKRTSAKKPVAKRPAAKKPASKPKSKSSSKSTIKSLKSRGSQVARRPSLAKSKTANDKKKCLSENLGHLHTALKIAGLYKSVQKKGKLGDKYYICDELRKWAKAYNKKHGIKVGAKSSKSSSRPSSSSKMMEPSPGKSRVGKLEKPKPGQYDKRTFCVRDLKVNGKSVSGLKKLAESRMHGTHSSAAGKAFSMYARSKFPKDGFADKLLKSKLKATVTVQEITGGYPGKVRKYVVCAEAAPKNPFGSKYKTKVRAA